MMYKQTDKKTLGRLEQTCKFVRSEIDVPLADKGVDEDNSAWSAVRRRYHPNVNVAGISGLRRHVA